MYNGSVTNYYTKKPMANVPVSDGMNIVFTDEEGKFSLPGWERANIISVNMLTLRHDDWFLSIAGHKGDFDFIVKPVEVGENFRILHTSDTEIVGSKTNEWFDFVKGVAKEQKPTFAFNTGDLCSPDGVSRHHLLMNSETLGCPVRYAIGNHDFCPGPYGEALYEKYYGPTWYSFDAGNVHFVVLSIGLGDHPTMYPKDMRLEWFRRDIELCAKGKKVIVVSHSFYRGKEAYGHTLWEVEEIAKDNVIALIHGHDHYSFSYEHNNYVTFCVGRPDTGGIDASPACVRMINVDGQEITSDYFYDIKECDDTPETKSEWKTKLNGNVEYSTPLEKDGFLWVCTNDDNYPCDCGIYKIDMQTGNIACHIKTKGIKADGAIYEDKFYVQDVTGILWCVDTNSGEVVWTQKNDLSKTVYTKYGEINLDGTIKPVEIFGRSDFFYTRYGVIMAEDKVISGRSAHVHCRDKDTGELIWKNSGGAAECPARTIYDEKRGNLLVSRNWKGFYAINLKTGETVWENTDREPCWFSNSTPVLDGDIIYKRGDRMLAKIDAETGKVLESVTTKFAFAVSGRPLVYKQYIFVPTGNSGVAVFNKETLELVKCLEAKPTLIYTSPYLQGKVQTVESAPMVYNNNIVFASSDGYVHFYDIDTLEETKFINVKSPIITTPTIKDGYIYVADFRGNVAKYEI